MTALQKKVGCSHSKGRVLLRVPTDWLALCKRFGRVHKGRERVESSGGKGGSGAANVTAVPFPAHDFLAALAFSGAVGPLRSSSPRSLSRARTNINAGRPNGTRTAATGSGSG